MNEIKKIQYNCKRATYLIEKKQIVKLTIVEQFKLKIHLTGCSVCRVFQQQSIIINSMAKKIFYDSVDSTLKLDEMFKMDLQNQIENKLKNN